MTDKIQDKKIISKSEVTCPSDNTYVAPKIKVFGDDNNVILTTETKNTVFNSKTITGTLANCGVPSEYIQLGELTNQTLGLDTLVRSESNPQIVEGLPRKADGSVDNEALCKALEMVILYHKTKNAEAFEKLAGYGIYSKVVNGQGGYASLFVGPELAKAVKENELLGEDVANYLKTNDSDAPAFFSTPITSETESDGVQVFLPKKAQDIMNNINTQNADFDKLLASLGSEDFDVNKFLDEYKRLTGTSFNYDGIIKTGEILKDSNASEGDKISAEITYFGQSVNQIETLKNEQATYATGHGVMDAACSVIAKFGLPGRIIANAIPLHVNIADTLTQGTEEGEWINVDNITLDNFIKVNKETLVDMAIINFAPFLTSKAGQFLHNWLNTGSKGTRIVKGMAATSARTTTTTVTNASIDATGVVVKKAVKPTELPPIE